jgi:hypothetical protein
MARKTQKRLKVRLTTHDYRHLAIAIGRVAVGERFAHGYVDEIGEVEAPEMDTNDPLEMSAGRGGEIGGNRYGVRVNVVKYMNDRSISTFRPLSEKWHRFLGLDSFSTSKAQKHTREVSPHDTQQSIHSAVRGRLAGDDTRGHIANWGSAMAQLNVALRQRQEQQTQTRTEAHNDQWFFGQNSQMIQRDAMERSATPLEPLSSTRTPTES